MRQRGQLLGSRCQDGKVMQEEAIPGERRWLAASTL